MGYGDYTPSSHHPKKPLTKAQLKKLQDQYHRANEILSDVKQKEQNEKNEIERDAQELMNNIL